jgi:hypothetical protein
MYFSFFFGSYAVKFLNGESTDRVFGLDTGVGVVFGVVSIRGCDEPLDCLAGVFFLLAAPAVDAPFLGLFAGLDAAARLRAAALAFGVVALRLAGAFDLAAGFAFAAVLGLAAAFFRVAAVVLAFALDLGADFALEAAFAFAAGAAFAFALVLVLPAARFAVAAFFLDDGAMIRPWFLTLLVSLK